LQISREPVSYRPVEVPGPSFNSSLFSDCASAGLGGFFAVYRCRRGEQYVAVKVPHQLSRYFETGRLASLTRQPEPLQREVEVVKKLDHPNVLRLLEAYPEYGILVYEWGDGGTLASQDLSTKDKLKALVHVAEGLRYLHELGLYHGDLKPTNVVIVGGVCKLADLASLRSALSTSLGSRYAGCTKGFCAPEQVFSDLAAEAKSLGLQNRRDVYQLGNLALWLFGVGTIDGEQWDQAAVDNAAEKLEKEVRGLGALVKTTLALKPSERPHIVEVLKALVEIYLTTKE
ncbi:protein kinase family protein, partial [Pyrobaculum sp.]|uniref:protein kinase family protein n=1 Tax=Pyrobaculum sp. TaxID=2004705 RepID=UPI003D0DF29F